MYGVRNLSFCFILAEELFLKTLWSLAIYLLVSNDLNVKLVSSLKLIFNIITIIFDDNSKVTYVRFLLLISIYCTCVKKASKLSFFSFCVCNAKSFVTACVIVVFFLLDLVDVSVMDWQKKFLPIFHHSFPRERDTRIKLFSLDSFANVFVGVLFIVKLCVCNNSRPCALKINSNRRFEQEHMKSYSSRTKNIVSSLPQCFWPPNLTEWWLIVRVSQT